MKVGSSPQLCAEHRAWRCATCSSTASPSSPGRRPVEGLLRRGRGAGRGRRHLRAAAAGRPAQPLDARAAFSRGRRAPSAAVTGLARRARQGQSPGAPHLQRRRRGQPRRHMLRPARRRLRPGRDRRRRRRPPGPRGRVVRRPVRAPADAAPGESSTPTTGVFSRHARTRTAPGSGVDGGCCSWSTAARASSGATSTAPAPSSPTRCATSCQDASPPRPGRRPSPTGAGRPPRRPDRRPTRGGIDDVQQPAERAGGGAPGDGSTSSPTHWDREWYRSRPSGCASSTCSTTCCPGWRPTPATPTSSSTASSPSSTTTSPCGPRPPTASAG